MRCIIGIDLGSTTTKAICIDENDRILGRGITNSRSNYALACEIAREEAAINSRFHLLRIQIEERIDSKELVSELMAWLECKFKLAQHMRQVAALEKQCLGIVDEWSDQDTRPAYRGALSEILDRMRHDAQPLFRPNVGSRSDFFRDIASSQYMESADALANNGDLSFERLTGIFDKAILLVESESFARDYEDYLDFASRETIHEERFSHLAELIQSATEHAANTEFEIINTIGTGYGRQTLPFPKKQIRSEILCHGLGAHRMFPETRTVLDIGGQDTKAIQVDARGIVTNFQMNDRCAAGCGRYLGYIADEMNMGVHELGPLALNATKTTRINSTCTVFAGAELRERLAMGERREDILSGLHRAIILRALSLLARSGGVRNEFTFTGGVAKNPAATQVLKTLITENYGEMTMNVSADSIFTGALGAALFGKLDRRGKLVNVDLTKLRKKAS
jgi:benzoyl-CoA reductase subunit A